MRDMSDPDWYDDDGDEEESKGIPIILWVAGFYASCLIAYIVYAIMRGPIK